MLFTHSDVKMDMYPHQLRFHLVMAAKRTFRTLRCQWVVDQDIAGREKSGLELMSLTTRILGLRHSPSPARSP